MLIVMFAFLLFSSVESLSLLLKKLTTKLATIREKAELFAQALGAVVNMISNDRFSRTESEFPRDSSQMEDACHRI